MRLRTVFAMIAAVGAVTIAAPAPAALAAPSLQLSPGDREPAGGQATLTDEALAELEAAVAKEPKSRMARFRLVRALLSAGRAEAALAEATAWRKVDAYNLIVVRMLGDIYTALGQTGKALRAYSAVVELLPEDPRAQRALASVLKQSGATAAARARLVAATRLRPDDVRLQFDLADADQRLGNAEQAIAGFEAIVGKDGAPDAITYPAKQRLAQLYSTRRRAALADGDTGGAAALAERIAALDIKGGNENDIKIYLSWDTDRSDVDLWVVNPAGEKVFYSHRTGKFGGTLYHDVTSGYGPESFTAHRAARGRYAVKVNYYRAAGTSFPEARGDVVVVLNEGRTSETRHVLPYRLFEAGQTVTVATIDVGGKVQ